MYPSRVFPHKNHDRKASIYGKSVIFAPRCSLQFRATVALPYLEGRAVSSRKVPRPEVWQSLFKSYRKHWLSSNESWSGTLTDRDEYRSKARSWNAENLVLRENNNLWRLLKSDSSDCKSVLEKRNGDPIYTVYPHLPSTFLRAPASQHIKKKNYWNLFLFFSINDMDHKIQGLIHGERIGANVWAILWAVRAWKALIWRQVRSKVEVTPPKQCRAVKGGVYLAWITPDYFNPLGVYFVGLRLRSYLWLLFPRCQWFSGVIATRPR